MEIKEMIGMVETAKLRAKAVGSEGLKLIEFQIVSRFIEEFVEFIKTIPSLTIENENIEINITPAFVENFALILEFSRDEFLVMEKILARAATKDGNIQLVINKYDGIWEKNKASFAILYLQGAKTMLGLTASLQPEIEMSGNAVNEVRCIAYVFKRDPSSEGRSNLSDSVKYVREFEQYSIFFKIQAMFCIFWAAKIVYDNDIAMKSNQAQPVLSG